MGSKEKNVWLVGNRIKKKRKKDKRDPRKKKSGLLETVKESKIF